MFTIQIADLNISIHHKYEFVKNICKNYIIENCGYDFEISVNEDEISAEKVINGANLSDGFIESVCIYRKIAERLPFYDAFVIHGAAIEYDGKAFCFLAKSGTGKTTHIKLWRALLGDKVLPINGDKPIIRRFGHNYFVCGTPWSGKEMYNRKVAVPLCGICVLSRSEHNTIQRLSSHDALNQLIDHTFFPKNHADSLKTIDYLGDIVTSTPIWKLACNISADAAKISFNALYNCYDE